jgi:ATP-dependent Lhr-like helicase
MGRTELGRVDPSLLIEEVQGERRLLLGGRSWRVTYIDWRRRRCFVEPADGGGRARWMSLGRAGLSYELTQAMRAVLLGEDPPVRLTKRAVAALEHQRAERAGLVHPGGTLIVRHDSGDVQWWTWAGFRANATLAATLSEVIDPMHRFDDRQIRLRDDLTPAAWRDAVRARPKIIFTVRGLGCSLVASLAVSCSSIRRGTCGVVFAGRQVPGR